MLVLQVVALLIKPKHQHRLVFCKQEDQIPPETWWHSLTDFSQLYDSHFLDDWRNATEIKEMAFSISCTDRGRHWKADVSSPSVPVSWENDPGPHTGHSKHFPSYSEREEISKIPAKLGAASRGKREKSRILFIELFLLYMASNYFN